jgi:hypothetical protein
LPAPGAARETFECVEPHHVFYYAAMVTYKLMMPAQFGAKQSCFSIDRNLAHQSCPEKAVLGSEWLMA